MTQRRRRTYRVLLCGALSFVVGATATSVYVSHGNNPSRLFSVCQAQSPLISRTLDCDEYDRSAARMDTLNKTLSDAVARYRDNGDVKRISVWVRDLETKQYAAVNETNTFAPASLLKVPLAIAYYKYAEVRPDVLSMPLAYEKIAALNDQYNYFTPASSLEIGKSYTVEDLIERMLKRSDNGAYYLLLQSIDQSFYDRVMLDLGIKIPTNNAVIDFITVQSYANIFRNLYNASYLERSASQHILDVLSTSDFSPIREASSGATVASKFGERAVFDQHGNALSRELHECGIVYKGDRPYSLCIMTEGIDFDVLARVIRDLAAIVSKQI